MRLAARGLPLVCVNPAVVLRRRRRPPRLDPARAQLPARPRARSTRTARSAWSTCATSPRATCWPTSAARWASATSSAGATSPSTGCSPTSGGCPASSRRCKLPAGRRARGCRRCWAAAAARRRSRSAPRATGGPTARPRRKRELGWRARPHEETLEATVAWHLEREHDRIARTRRSQQLQYRLAGAAIGAVEDAAGLAGAGAATGRGYPEPGVTILYRCKAPDGPGLPLRQGGAPAAQRWASSTRRCGCRSSSATGPRSRS